MKRKFRVCILIISLYMFCGCSDDSLQYVGEEKVDAEAIANETVQGNTAEYDIITVHICGEVYFPGVYDVYSGSRIYEVVKQAGGFTKDADTVAVNQAKEVSDGEQIYIPSIKETEENDAKPSLIDLNKANAEQLCTIPGIGQVKAKQIIDYREKNGNFHKIEDIMNISGIKEGLFEQISPYITVS